MERASLVLPAPADQRNVADKWLARASIHDPAAAQWRTEMDLDLEEVACVRVRAEFQGEGADRNRYGGLGFLDTVKVSPRTWGPNPCDNQRLRIQLPIGAEGDRLIQEPQTDEHYSHHKSQN